MVEVLVKGMALSGSPDWWPEAAATCLSIHGAFPLRAGQQVRGAADLAGVCVWGGGGQGRYRKAGPPVDSFFPSLCALPGLCLHLPQNGSSHFWDRTRVKAGKAGIPEDLCPGPWWLGWPLAEHS